MYLCKFYYGSRKHKALVYTYNFKKNDEKKTK